MITWSYYVTTMSMAYFSKYVSNLVPMANQTIDREPLVWLKKNSTET